METKYKLLLLSFLMSFQYTFAQSAKLSSSFNNVVETFNEYDITSVDIKEIDGLFEWASGSTGLLRFNSQKLIFDGTNLQFSYKQTPASRYANANSKYWKPGTFSVSIPIEGTSMEVSRAFGSSYKYYVIKVKNRLGITKTANGTKELINEYSFASTQELTANKFYNELNELIMAIKEEQYNGKLGIKSSRTHKSTQSSRTSSNKSQSKKVAKKGPSQANNSSQRRSVKNTGNRSTKTIIK